jgi:hypothetical protein
MGMHMHHESLCLSEMLFLHRGATAVLACLQMQHRRSQAQIRESTNKLQRCCCMQEVPPITMTLAAEVQKRAHTVAALPSVEECDRRVFTQLSQKNNTVKVTIPLRHFGRNAAP